MICFDTSVIIWVVQETPPRGQEEQAAKARAYVKRLQDERQEILVPVTVIQEYLYKIAPTGHDAAIAAFNAYFQVVSYNAAMASIATRLFATSQNKVKVDRTKVCVKADCQIIATAIHMKASAIVTNNIREFERLAAGEIKIWSVPDPPAEQMPLPHT